ncbi:ssDNA-binding protein [Rhodopseudomonas palustris]
MSKEKARNGDDDKGEVRLYTPVFRLSFPNLFVPKASEDYPDAEPKYGLSAIWTPSEFTDREKKLWRAILAELDTVALAAFGRHWKELPDNIKRGLRDGAGKDSPGYGPGTRFANITTKFAPGVVDKDGETDISKEDGNTHLIYPGCYCRATVNVYSFGLKKGSKGRGVALGLFSVQKIKDGQRLDNRRSAADDFAGQEIDDRWLDDEDDNDADGFDDGGDDDDDFN